MQLLNDMIAYWTGTQAQYSTFDFQSDSKYKNYYDDETFGLLNTDDISKSIAAFKGRRGLILYQNVLYKMDTQGRMEQITKTTPDIGALKVQMADQPLNVYQSTTKPVDINIITDITGYIPFKKGDSVKNLYETLSDEFNIALKTLVPPMLDKAQQIRIEIDKLAAKQFKKGKGLEYVTADVELLNQVLKRCTIAFTPPETGKEEAYNANAAQLALLSKELPGYAGWGWTILAGLLAMVAIQAIMFGIILSCGTAIPLGFMGAMGATWILSSMTAAAAPAAVAIGHGVTATAVASAATLGGGAGVLMATGVTGFYKNKVLAKAVDELATEIKKPTPP